MTYFIHSSDPIFEGKSDMEINRENHNFWEMVEIDRTRFRFISKIVRSKNL